MNTTRRTFLKTMATATAAAALPKWATGQAPAIAKKHPPNIVMISTDQWHADAFGYRGDTQLSTPHSDRIASWGVDVRRAYAADPVCAPARSSWLTGRMPVEHGVIGNGVKLNPAMIDSGQWFGDHGYETAHFGKWHTTGRDPEKSFHFYAGIHPAGQYGDMAIAETARAYLLSRNKDKPSFLHVAFMNPHDTCQMACLRTAEGKLPYEVELPPLPENFRARPPEPETMFAKVRNSSRRVPLRSWKDDDWRFYRWTYYRYCEQAEMAIGRVLDALEASGELDNTLLVYTSDHGEGLGHHGLTAKAFLYEESARVPFSIAFPGRLPAGTTDDRMLVSGIDLFPSFCDAAGIPAPPNLPGRSVLAQLQSGKPSSDPLVTSASFGGWMARDDRYKYIRYQDSTTTQLFDLKDDPGETKNIAAEKASIVDQLDGAMREFRSRLIPANPAAANGGGDLG